MRSTLLAGLALAAGLTAFSGATSVSVAAPAVPAALHSSGGGNAAVIKAGYRQRQLRGYRSGMRWARPHRARPYRAPRFGIGRPRRTTGMVVQPGIVTILRYCKRQELLPGGDPRCP